MTTYEAMMEYLEKNSRITNMRQACYRGKLAISYNQARRCIRRAEINGDVVITRQDDEQGRPLIVQVVRK